MEKAKRNVDRVVDNVDKKSKASKCKGSGRGNGEENNRLLWIETGDCGLIVDNVDNLINLVDDVGFRPHTQKITKATARVAL